MSPRRARHAYRFLAPALSLATRYEAIATNKMVAEADFHRATSVFEFGCGTGHFAQQLLRDELPDNACYRAVDVTPKMVSLTRQRLARDFASRAGGLSIELSDGGAPRDEAAESYDRFVSNFVLDILPESEIADVLSAAHRMLRQDGLLCLASLSLGSGRLSAAVMSAWKAIYSLRPELLGGCRPLSLSLPLLLDETQWEVVYNETVQPLAVPLEVLVARKR